MTITGSEKMSVLSALEMFNDLVSRGLVVPAAVAPARLKAPTAYITVPTVLAFSTPPIPSIDEIFTLG